MHCCTCVFAVRCQKPRRQLVCGGCVAWVRLRGLGAACMATGAAQQHPARLLVWTRYGCGTITAREVRSTHATRYTCVWHALIMYKISSVCARAAVWHHTSRNTTATGQRLPGCRWRELSTTSMWLWAVQVLARSSSASQFIRPGPTRALNHTIGTQHLDPINVVVHGTTRAHILNSSFICSIASLSSD